MIYQNDKFENTKNQFSICRYFRNADFCLSEILDLQDFINISAFLIIEM